MSESKAHTPSPLLTLPGAVAGDPPDEGVAAHYGSIVSEQRRLLEGNTFVDLSHRDVVTIGGPDRLGWLHSLTTQFLEGLAPGVHTEVLLLSPQGRIEHGFAGVDVPSTGSGSGDGTGSGSGDGTFWAHTEPGAGAALVEFLDSMRFMMRVEVALNTEFVVVGVNRATTRDKSPELDWELHPRDELIHLPDTLGVPVGLWAWEALRIESGMPRIGLDTDDRTIPNEAGLLDVAVHLDKGCYRGQETVARVHTLGRPPRRLVLLHLDGSVDRLPERGADVMSDGVRVGAVGTSARHHELGPIALSLVKRKVDPEATLLADGIAAAQQVLVDPEAGLHVRPVLR